MRTTDEKLKHNERQKTPFGFGYCWGVKAYRGYTKLSKSEKQRAKADISYNAQLVKTGKTEATRSCAKGYMCGIRDAANDRKARQKEIPP